MRHSQLEPNSQSYKAEFNRSHRRLELAPEPQILRADPEDGPTAKAGNTSKNTKEVTIGLLAEG